MTPSRMIREGVNDDLEFVSPFLPSEDRQLVKVELYLQKMFQRIPRVVARTAISRSTRIRCMSTQQQATTKLGFVGLGNMGLPMCINLLKSNKEIMAFDTKEVAIAKAQENGIQTVSSLDEIGNSDCEIVFTMLPGDQAVDAVMPVLIKNQSPRIIVDCSTVSPSTSRKWNDVAQQSNGGAMLDAPVSGGVKGATDATLTFMVGADDTSADSPFETIKPLLELMGSRVAHCGGSGTGAATKLCNNLALAAQMIGVCEALNLGEALGVDPVVLSDVMNTSTAKSWSTDICNPHPKAAANIKERTGGTTSPPASRDYQGGFGTRLMLKDLGLAVSAGQEEGLALPLGATSKELYRLADLRGHGDKDFGVMLQFLRGK